MGESRPEPSRLLEAAFLADHAALYGSQVSVLGAFANLVSAAQLPALHQMTLVMRIAWVGARVGGHDLHIAIQVEDPSGKAIVEIEGSSPLDEEDTPHPEIPIGLPIVIPLTMMIETLGVHRVLISINGELTTALPFKVIESEI